MKIQELQEGFIRLAVRSLAADQSLVVGRTSIAGRTFAIDHTFVADRTFAAAVAVGQSKLASWPSAALEVAQGYIVAREVPSGQSGLIGRSATSGATSGARNSGTSGAQQHDLRLRPCMLHSRSSRRK